MMGIVYLKRKGTHRTSIYHPDCERASEQAIAMSLCCEALRRLRAGNRTAREYLGQWARTLRLIQLLPVCRLP